jgi:putative transposase
MGTMQMQTRSNSAFKLVYHLVLSTKWRRKTITQAMLTDLEYVSKNILEAWDCKMIEFGGEVDHVHILFEAIPSIELSKLVNNLKSVTSRKCRQAYAEHLSKFYWGDKPQFWAKSYGILTVGTTVSLDKLVTYVQTQEKPEG